jgi:3-methyladenine DNA glycosylase/8-oxoguanine DNA glycosylase
VSAAPGGPALVRTIGLDRPLDLRAVLGIYWRGPGDPTMRLTGSGAARATRTADGPATLIVRLDGGAVRAEAHGPGAAAALDGLPALLGLDDDDAGFEPRRHPLVADLARRHPGVRLGRTANVWEALLPAILEQKVTGTEAQRGFRGLVLGRGEPAPGPLPLRLPPLPATVADLPSHAFPPLGIEPRRGALLRRLAAEASRLESMAAASLEPGGGGAGSAALDARLRAFAGIGPWTSSEVRIRALGDPDAVSVADAHLSHAIGWALAREARASDARMLELLAPWAGHRQRVIRLVELAGIGAPRFGPRVAPKDIRGW